MRADIASQKKLSKEGELRENVQGFIDRMSFNAWLNSQVILVRDTRTCLRRGLRLKVVFYLQRNPNISTMLTTDAADAAAATVTAVAVDAAVYSFLLHKI